MDLTNRISLKDPTPLYKQIAQDLEMLIVTKFIPGDRLESHMKLAKRYDVSLITLKRAIHELSSKGLVYTRVGKGTFVS